MVYLGRVATSKAAPDSIVRVAVSARRQWFRAGKLALVAESIWKGASEFNDKNMYRHKKLLFGPGVDVLTALSEAMQEEVTQLKDKLDIVERGIDPDVTDVTVIVANLERLAGILFMLELSKMETLVRSKTGLIKTWSETGVMPGRKSC